MSLSVSSSNPRNEIAFIPFLSQVFVRDQEWYIYKKKNIVFALSFLSGHAGAATASAVRVLLIQHHMILSPFFVVAHR